MEIQPLTRQDARLAVAVAWLVAVCAVYIWTNYAQAFPQASLELKVSKSQITKRASEFARRQGWSLDGFRNITVFDPDDNARLYLERELGLDEANRLMRGRVSVWRWRVRWFRPPEPEEFIVFLSPDGAIAGFNHAIAEAAAGARLSPAQARDIAARFVASRTSQPLRLVEDRLEQKPNRYDYSFTWEDEGFHAKAATYRRTVVVQGDRVGRYAEFLYIPEAWTREFAAVRSKNDLYAAIAQACWIPLILAAIAVGIRALRRKAAPWRPLTLIAAVVGGLVVINHLNSLPFLVDEFPTSSPYSQTILLLLLQGLGAGVGTFFYVSIAAVAGEPLYAADRPGGLSLRNAFTRRGLASREFFRATIAGYGLAAAHLAFLVAFYLIGRRFGVWSPQDVAYSDMLSTPLPWIYPVATACMAASAEEFWFRLFAIPLLRRALKQTWIAVVVPAFVWGFLHANYPQEPAWIRGVEVGLIGIAAGVVMLRFGILATLVWHYAVDALLIGIFLFEAQSWYFRLSGWILAAAIGAPLIISAVLYRRNGGFIMLEPPLSHFAAAAPAPELPGAPPVRPPWPAWRLYAAAAAVLAIGAAAHPVRFGDWNRVRITRNQAESIARRAIPSGASWRIAVDFVANLSPAEFEYLRRIAGVSVAQTAVREHQLSALWRVRFFRPLNKEEWIVYVTQDGRVSRTEHILDERAPGASLTVGQARQIAERALSNPALVLIDSNQRKRDRRIDYSFTYEDPSFHLGEARARVSVDIYGDEPSNIRRFIKLPEAWLRDFESPSLRKLIAPAMVGATCVSLLVLFIRRLAVPELVLHWRAYSATGCAALAIAVLSGLNGSATAWAAYSTAMPEQEFVAQYLIARGIRAVLISGVFFAAALGADVFRQAVTGRARMNCPSIARTAVVAALAAGLARALAWGIEAAPGPRETLPIWSLPGVDAWLPGWRAFALGWLLGPVVACGAGCGVFVLLRYLHGWRRMALIALGVVGLAASQSLTVAQFAASAAAVVIWIAAIVLIARTCAVDLVGYAVAMCWAIGIPAALELARQPAGWVRWNGVAAAVALAVSGVALIAAFNARRRAEVSQ